MSQGGYEQDFSANFASALGHGRQLGEQYRVQIPKQAVKGGIGERIGNGTGASLEFQEYREYQPGDDLRRLDWRAYARSDRLTVRLYREEVRPCTDIILDCSRSMLVPAVKAEAAISLLGLLGEAACRADTSLSCISFGNGWTRLMPRVMQFPDKVQIPDFSGESELAVEMRRQRPRLAKSGIRMCISDFLWEADPNRLIRQLKHEAAALYLLNVLAEEELEPPSYGAVRLEDAESGLHDDMNIDQAQTNAYKKRLADHLQLWRDAAVRNGAIFTTIRAEDIFDAELDAMLSTGILE